MVPRIAKVIHASKGRLKRMRTVYSSRQKQKVASVGARIMGLREF